MYMVYGKKKTTAVDQSASQAWTAKDRSISCARSTGENAKKQMWVKKANTSEEDVKKTKMI